jgi:predicted  nucleic acid-binding Zn-ribbon protein
MKKYDHLQMHQEHRTWDSDLQMWSHDLKMWEEEIEALNSALQFINDAIKSHQEALMDHLKALVDHRDRINKHEVDIKYVRESSKLDGELLDMHKDETIQHEIQHRAHERIKKYHHTIMALTKGLKKSLESV